MSGNAKVDGYIMTICPQRFMEGKRFPPPILLWNPDQKVNYRSLWSVVFGGLMTRGTDEYTPLESLATDFSTEDFYQTYLDPDTKLCFDIDVSELLP
jgi:hypothetical protein